MSKGTALCTKCKERKTTYGVGYELFHYQDLCYKCELEDKKDDLNCFDLK